MLILIPRHIGNNFFNLIKELVVVNGGVLLIEYNERSGETEKNTKFKIVGSIRREQRRNLLALLALLGVISDNKYDV